MIERKAGVDDNTFEVRPGIHSGSVVAGIAGIRKFAYDIWGDTVNAAAKMEQRSRKGQYFRNGLGLVQDRFECTYRGKI